MKRFIPIPIALLSLALPLSAEPDAKGAAIYEKQCMECHGQDGQGVAEEHDEPLAGTRPFEKLVRYVHRTMPEDEAEKCVDEEAQLVAHYIWEEFYSPEAQTRRSPPRISSIAFSKSSR